MRARTKFLLTFIYSKAYHIIINYIKSYMFGGIMQHEITKPQRLLDENGNIKEPGFAKKMLWAYNIRPEPRLTMALAILRELT